MVYQHQQKYFAPALWAVKVAMGLVVLRLTLLPFFPAWQGGEPASWNWVLLTYLPALVILWYAGKLLRKQDRDLSDWFNGAFLHIVVMALVTQTHYWLTGHVDLLRAQDFNSVAIYACQTLALAAVYTMRSKTAGLLGTVYTCYSLALFGVGLLCLLLLNSRYFPLVTDTVPADAWPLFNWLAIGWAVPGMLMLLTGRFNLVVPPLKRQWFYYGGAGLLGAWVLLSIRQFWQTESMSLYESISMAENFSYSATGLAIGAALTAFGVFRAAFTLQRAGLVLLAVVVLKVFLLDVASLEGLWRAASFLGLGASLIGLGWVFQRLDAKRSGM